MSSGPRYAVRQVRFSISLMPATISAAHGWRIESIFILPSGRLAFLAADGIGSFYLEGLPDKAKDKIGQNTAVESMSKAHTAVIFLITWQVGGIEKGLGLHAALRGQGGVGAAPLIAVVARSAFAGQYRTRNARADYVC
jgi:hypothetical protein